MKRKLSLALLLTFLLCLILPFSLFLSGSAETFDLSVYLSPDGNGENDGLTEQTPVSTLAEALAVAEKEVGDNSSAKVHFILLGNLSVSNDPYGTTPFAFNLTVSGKTGSENLIATGTYIHHMGDTRYENMCFTQASSSNYSFLCGNGYDLVMGKGLSCTPSSKGYYLNLAGGVHGNKSKDFNSDSSLTVLSGQWETLYAGSYKENQKGNATLYAENCQIHTNVGTCFTEDHVGTSEITLKNCEIAIKSAGMLQGGPTNAAGTLSDKLTLTLENCNVRDFGVGYKRTITAPLSLSIKDCTIEDAYSVTATGDCKIHLFATEGKTLDMTPAKTFEADTFTGGGTLILGSESLLVANSVSGSTKLSLGTSPASRTYVRAAADTPDNAFTYSGTPAMKIRISGGEKVWTTANATTLKAPENTTLTLYTKFTDGEKVTPDSQYTKDGETFYVFDSLSAGNYRYNVKGTGYYQITKALYLSSQKLSNDLIIDCTPPLLAGTGFEPNTSNPNVKDYTDEMRANFLNSDPANWSEYSFIFTTPYFTRGSYEKGLHQATTQDEMMAYLNSCVAKSENLYLFSLGKSPSKGYDIPIVVFTTSDLSKAKTLAEAAEICKANGKLNVQYQAQVHGNEPAGGEGALAVIGALTEDWGKQYADDMNICIIPRINTDGSYAYTRNQVTQKRNLNRDYLQLQAEEIPMILQAYNLFSPEIVVDGHEFTCSTESTSGAFNDATMGTGGNENIDSALEETGVAMIFEAFDHLAENNLTSSFYSSQDDSTDPCTARGYYQMRGSVSLLVETSGIHAGQGGFHRRVVSQFLCMETFLNYAKEHKTQFQTLSAAIRKNLVEEGSTYDADRAYALKTATVPHDQTYPKTVYSYATGLATGTKNVTIKSADTVERSRSFPTAYVIPKDAKSSAILRIADGHNIFYYELDKGDSAHLFGYNGSYDASTKAVSDVTLTEEALVSFPNGAYVFPMNQEGCILLAAMFEPDNDDVYNTSDKTYTLAQDGLISYENGGFVMYRSQRDLTDGKISVIPAADAPENLLVTKANAEDYTGSITGLDPALSYEFRHETQSNFSPVPTGSTRIDQLPFGKVEIRLAAKNGVPASKIQTLDILPPASAAATVYLAPSTGSDDNFGGKNTPVKTIDRAIELLTILNRYSDEKATLIFSETLSLTKALVFPEYDFPLYITSLSGSEGIRSSKNITFGGETVVDDFTFTLTSTGYSYILANGHKLTLGENIQSAAEKDVYYMPTGGGYDSPVQSTDITILGGTWRNVYAGGYKGSVAGDAILVLKNATVVAQVQNSYSGKTGGNVHFDLENVTVNSAVYCGNAGSQDVGGNIVLKAKNCTIPLLHAGSRDAGNVDGVVTVTLEKCTAGNLYGTCKNENSSVLESHLTLIDTNPDGTVAGWTSVSQGKPQVKGDSDGNGTLDLDDAIHLLFYVNFPESYPVSQAVDYDGNGTVEMDDAIYLLFHINFPEAYPLH